MADPSGGAASESTADHTAPPLTHRRPRVREVSSRFMSPLIQSNSSPIPNPTALPRSKSARNRPPPISDENHMPEVNRSFEKSSNSFLSTLQRKNHHQRVKQQNGEPKFTTNPILGSLNSSSNGCAAVTAAARLLQEATSDVQRRLSKSSRDDSDICSTASNLESSSSCPNSPLCLPSSKLRIGPDIRSSMPDVDKWLADRSSCNNGGKITSDCARSLNFSSSAKIGGGVILPPHPSSYIRSGLDSKKGKRVSNQLEDVHSLKMMSNHHLQWRFSNAKAEAVVRAQKQEAERKFFSLGAKISDMRDNVRRQRSELAVLRGIKALTTVVEGQIPYLDEWASLEKDYSTSLIDTTNALLSSSARLPVSGNVRVDVGELGEALGSALKMVETIGSHIQRFIPKAEEMDMSVSELARMAGGESALIEECGDLISKTYVSQVKECSLRGTLIQVRNSNRHQNQKSEEEKS
ncbi:protein endosperm defective 1 [Phtheirospermum japonicum]|uniref:Protein endosperm defective 1 n=1 Tax=Phtheirospermum japonicum TaxID=374723 RepID=A0A830D8D5_9LAMI|nr:protein endosperm defective 1 [Phtheirospermum japonicum]